MTLTLLAILIAPLCLKVVLDPKGTRKVLEEYGDSPALQFFMSFGTMFLGMFILLTNPFSFGWKWESVICWIGALTFVKGICQLIPSLVKWKLSWLTEKRLPIFGFLGLLFALGMVYIEVQLLS